MQSRHYKNPQANIDRVTRWRKSNMDKTLKYNSNSRKRRRILNKQLADSYKKCCEICGESNKYCLEFDHIKAENKLKNIAWLIQEPATQMRLINEIQKCRVICTNCHKIHHFTGKKPAGHLRRYIRDLKIKLSCSICGFKNAAVLEFHHINSDKDDHINKPSEKSLSHKSNLQNELLKTSVVCGNCHRKIHYDPDFNPELEPLDKSLI